MTLTQKLLLLLLLTAVVPIVLASLFLWTSADMVVERMTSFLANTARVTARSIANHVGDVDVDLDHYVQYEQTREAIERGLRGERGTLPLPRGVYDLVLAYDVSGRLLAASASAERVQGGQPPPCLQPGQLDRLANQANDAPVFVPSLAAERSGGCSRYCMGFFYPHVLTLGHAEPSRAERILFYVSLCSRTIERQLRAELDSSFDMAAVPSDAVRLLIANRTFTPGALFQIGPEDEPVDEAILDRLIHAQDEDLGSHTLAWSGTPHVTVFTRAASRPTNGAGQGGESGPDLWLALGIEERLVRGEVEGLWRNHVVVAASIAFLAALTALFFGRRMALPLRVLAQRAQDLSTREDRPSTPLAVTSRDEVGQLAASFLRMERDLHGKRLETRALVEKQERQNALLRALSRLRTHRAEGHRVVYARAIETLARHLDAPTVLACTVRDDDVRALAAWIDDAPATPAEWPVGILAREAMRVERSVLVEDAQEQFGEDPIVQQLGLRALAAVPLRPRGSGALGFVLVARAVSPTTEEVTILELFAEWIVSELELEQLERQFVQHEKMASLGGLAAGMAHEINNPLGGVLQNLQLLGYSLDPLDPRTRERLREAGFDAAACDALAGFRREHLQKYLDRIEQSGRRAARIVADLLDFSRKRTPSFGWHDTRELIMKTLDLARVEYDLKKRFDIRNVEIDVEIVDGAERVWADAHQISQVLLNLIKNAGQALVEPAARGDEPPHLLLGARPAANHRVVLFVEDNGPGIREVPPERIFEPFFTTKQVGQGTGLGLYVSYFLVTDLHQGAMRVETEPGHGTRIEIELPPPRESERHSA